MKFTIGHLFCGIGGSALGTSAATARIGDQHARFECVGGVDFDELACKDFERLVGAGALHTDVHDLQPADLRRAWGSTAPDVVMSSPPCKGFSGLLSSERSKEPRYERMNGLMMRALFLLCSTWDEPPALIFFENVPLIASRGKGMVRQAVALLEGAGYAVAVGNHDCGELGGLAQHRRRWFLLARHRTRVPPFVYQPRLKRVRACGEVLGPLPMPGDVAAGGAMHSVPNLSWKNWVRLGLIPAGGDWRDLPGVLAEGQQRRERFRRAPVTGWGEPSETVVGPGGSAAAAVADPRIAEAVAMADNPGRHWNKLAVTDWNDPAATVTGTDTRVGSGAPSVADPRPFGNIDRVTAWDRPVGCVTSKAAPASGGPVVADPRFGNVDRVTPWDAQVGTITRSPAPSSGGGAVADPRMTAYRGILGVSDWDEAGATVTGNARPASGRFAVADPRAAHWQHKAGVTPWSSPAPTVTSRAKIHSGAFQVADPRVQEWLARADTIEWLSFGCKPRPGAYGVLRWDEAAATITGSMSVDNGRASIADPRLGWDVNPDRPPPFTPVIIAADGTWHRPLTTLELAVLQSLPAIVDGKPLVLAGTSHTRWREAIGNMVPPDAARAVGNQLLRALLLAHLGAFELDNNEIWVSPPELAA